MKKLLLCLLALLCLIGVNQAQTQLPNVGYENWQNVGTNTEEPTNWNSNETGGGFASWGPQTCFRATSPYAGTYCAEMRTLNYLGNAVNGSITTGKIQAPSTNPADGYIETVRADANFNAPFTGRPDSLVGYYKYTQAGSDRAKVEVILHGNYDVRTPVDAGSTPFVIGTASFLGPQASVGTWTRFSVPFSYVNGNTPMYALAVATASSTQASAVVGSKLWLDDLQVIYNPAVAIGTLSPASPYYVSNTVGAAVSVPYTATGTFAGGNVFTAQLSNAAGSFASPTVIGTLTGTTSGTIAATIPAGTATGSGYRIRVVSSNPGLVSADNGSNLQINLCSNPIAPTAVQNLAANTNGTMLTTTESVAASSRNWKFAIVSGGPYTNFSPVQTSTNYTPNFANAGTYYVICESNYPGGLQVRSNEVQVNVVGNTVSPSGAQSLLVSANGNMLTVSESPAGTAREWKFGTVSGGPYSSFGPVQTAMTYTPNFSSPGTYYVVCVSTINSMPVTSNEVVITVGSLTLSTGNLATTSFDFSPSAPNATLRVPYTTSGAFNGGNTFRAELSNATGSFASPTIIGSLVATGSDTIVASLPSSTPAGTAYRIRVVGDNPATAGSDNGVNIVVNQFNNSIGPNTTQNIVVNSPGTALTVTESQTATRNWKVATVSGGPYSNIAGATAASYTPQFNTPGTFYVIAASVNSFLDTVRSNEVVINVANGTQLTTTTVSPAPYLVSPSTNVQSTVSYTSNAVYSAGNVFTAQLSDNNGSFVSPINIGSVTATTPSNIVATIPNNSPSGTGYRIRVVSTNPAITGTDNGVNLEIRQFENMLSPVDTQRINTNQNGLPINVTATHNATHNWMHRNSVLVPYISFVPAQTGSSYTPNFPNQDVKYIVCRSVNSAGDTVQTGEVVVYISNNVSTLSTQDAMLLAYWAGQDFVVDASRSDLSESAVFEMIGLSGQVVFRQALQGKNLHRFELSHLPAAVYVLRIVDGERIISAQTAKAK